MTWRVSIEHHGAERQPVVLIDHFAPDPAQWVDGAGFLSFYPIGEHYPGVRAPVPPSMLRQLLSDLAPVAEELFGAVELEVVDAFFSLVTTPPAALAPIQRLPHFDETSPGRLALLHFLSTDESSGTAFYRHRATGFESVDGARLPAYRTALQADVARAGLPEPGYIGGDTPLFEQLAVHRGTFNRALLYRSNTLHCALIPLGMNLSDDPATGRLTVNTFLDSRPAA
ncbi:hypothetical protein SAMN05192583_1759 [Sphingomonas gellani]|uniref:Uncharacterized protein n=1 Tax=Sphingomonas gellani TaxID=1166340 RepID=A0A1H8CW93_9SPHN|nr:DUF6445 family protein [Sphingomonas gellani]SEM98714.1 hypothetical protein SAMN05192583_1759 [Sphingomonas gellani]